MSLKLRWRNIVAAGECFHVARTAFSARAPMPLHGHDFAEIFWIDTGKACHQINGLSRPLQPGALVMIRPGDCHAIEPEAGQSLSLTNIAFPGCTMDFFRARYGGEISAKWGRRKEPACLQVEPAQLTLFNRWADLLSDAPRQQLAIDRFLINLLAEFTSDSEDLLPEGMPEWLLHACRETQKHAHFSRGTRAFIHLSGRSREHVARSIMQFLGITPTTYVNRLRIKYAARQLKITNQSILEIALDCGIDSVCHFYALFHQQFLMTPRAYRLASNTFTPGPRRR